MFLVLAAQLAACGPDRKTEAKRSAARFSRAVEALRNAPHDGKDAPLKALAELECSEPDVCRARDVCQAGYTLHVEAVKLTRVAQLDAKEGNTSQATRLLMSAQTKLGEAGEVIADCIERESVLRRAYGL